jgi:hypothetical protein
VPIDEVFATLAVALFGARDAVQQVHVAMAEDSPDRDAHPVVARAEALLELGDALDEELALATAARRAVEDGPDLDGARRSLARCHRRQLDAARRLRDLVAYEPVLEIVRVARERGGEWRPWARIVQAGLADCQGPFDRVDECVQRCWDSLAERAVAGGVSVRAIGQQINVPASAQLEELGFP